MKIDYENLFKRLLMLNQRGVYLQGRDGHVWIENDSEIEYPFVLHSVMVNNKIYGGVIQAIEVIDEALQIDGQGSLIDEWEKHGVHVLNLGYGGVDKSRIDKVSKGKGGLY